jgi:hypothetical protein
MSTLLLMLTADEFSLLMRPHIINSSTCEHNTTDISVQAHQYQLMLSSFAQAHYPASSSAHAHYI